MKITMMNKDFGNSLDMNLIDGFYIETPTNVVEISKDEADSHFVATITNPKNYYLAYLFQQQSQEKTLNDSS